MQHTLPHTHQTNRAMTGLMRIIGVKTHQNRKSKHNKKNCWKVNYVCRFYLMSFFSIFCCSSSNQQNAWPRLLARAISLSLSISLFMLQFVLCVFLLQFFSAFDFLKIVKRSNYKIIYSPRRSSVDAWTKKSQLNPNPGLREGGTERTDESVLLGFFSPCPGRGSVWAADEKGEEMVILQGYAVSWPSRAHSGREMERN